MIYVVRVYPLGISRKDFVYAGLKNKIYTFSTIMCN